MNKYLVSALMVAALTPSAAASPDRSKAADHLGNYCFQVEIDGVTGGSFKEIDGLGDNIETVEYQDDADVLPRKRPGKTSFGDIVIHKNPERTAEPEQWWQNLREGNLDKRSIDVKLSDDCTPPVIYDNFPTAWSFSGTVDSESSEMLTEEISITVEKIKFK